MRLLLVDATACLFRAFHAAPDLRAQNGAPTGAVFVLANILAKLRRQWPSEFLACVMDAPGGTFRHEMFPDYKAHRPPMDPDLRAQIEPAAEFIRAAGCPLLTIAGVEADDVIAALTAGAVSEKCEVVIASSDKDLMQLVGDGVQMVDGIRDKIYDAAAVREKYGVGPAQMADYLALVGDASDNIPGVKKVGAKTAAKWLNQFGDLQNLLRQSGEIKGVVGANLRAAAADGTLEMSRRLVELKTDVDAGRAWNELVPEAPDDSKWRDLCERYDFRNLTGAMREFSKTKNQTKSGPADPGPSGPGPTGPESDSGLGPDSNFPSDSDSATDAKPLGFGPGEIVRDVAGLEKWAQKIRAAGEFAFDTETVPGPDGPEMVGFSLAVAGESAYVPLAHEEDSPQVAKAAALAAVGPLFADSAVVKIAHNAKFDLHVLARAGVAVDGTVEDIKVAAFARFPGDPTNLSSLAARHLGLQKISYKEAADKKLYASFAEVPLARAAPYAASDAECAWRLRAPLIGGMDARERKLYLEFDRPLIPILARMERAGILVDADELGRLAAEMRKRMAELEARAVEIAGEEFNLNSPKQLARMLYDRGGADASRITASGARSTDERALERLADDFPLAATALEHRHLAKLAGTYAEKLPRMIRPSTGRVHTDFSQTGAVTGRLSSSGPNLQNIPIRTELGRRIRRAFAAPSGSVLISADYSQIELRLMAHVSGDAALREAFARGADIHRRTAAEVFGAEEGGGGEVSAERRRAAKAINFGLMYGMSAFGLARGLKITQTQARHYMDLYFSRYPGVADYMARAGKESMRRGFSETIFGRRVPILGKGPPAERAAINAPMQGGAADLMKRAMILADGWLRDSGLRTRMLLQVHDELILESPLEEAAEVGGRVRELMVGAAALSVPLAAEVRAGGNWDEAH